MLSKSKYCAFVQCPRRLWLQHHHPELSQEADAQTTRMETGNQVGDLAMQRFGSFTEVTAFRSDGGLDLPKMIAHTQELTAAEHPVICEASFSYDGNYCAADILRKEQGGYAIYEVKSAAHVQDVYAVDLAYQKFVLEHCGIRVTGTYLVHIDPAYVREAELDISRLFKTVDLSQAVEQELPLVASRIQAAKAALAGGEPAQDIGIHCDDPYHCPFWEHCSRHLPKPSVFDLYRLSSKKKFELYHKGMAAFQDLTQAPKLNEKQRRQIQFHLSDCGTHVDQEGVRNFLTGLSYPLYFLDFETMQPVIPPYPGTSPYQQIPFQYSLHYLQEPGGSLQHRAFLAESGTDPRRAIAESLVRDIPANACVLAYNRSFECSRLKELAEQFPDLAEQLLSIRENILDLMTPFQSGFYYNRAMGGSFSIKSVLPAIYPNDPELNYHSLEGVHNGGEAMELFPRIQDLPPEEQAIARRNLLEYCKLDTLALVKIWEELVRVCQIHT